MARIASTLIREPSLLLEDAEICARVRQDLRRCVEHCREEAEGARDESFSRALLSVATACQEGITALESHLVSLEKTGEGQPKQAVDDEPTRESSRTVGPIETKIKEESDRWRPGAVPTAPSPDGDHKIMR